MALRGTKWNQKSSILVACSCTHTWLLPVNWRKFSLSCANSVQVLYKYKYFFFQLHFISICIYINISGKLNPRNNTKGTDCGDTRSSGPRLFLLGGFASLQLGLFLFAVGRENLPGCVQVELPELLRQLDRLGHHSLQLIIIAHLQREFHTVRSWSSVCWWRIWRISQHSTGSWTIPARGVVARGEREPNSQGPSKERGTWRRSEGPSAERI